MPAQACGKQQVTEAHGERAEPICYHGFSSLWGGEKEEEKLGVGRKWQGLLKGRKQKPQTPQLGPGSMISQKGVYSKKLHLQPQIFRRSPG